MRDRTGNGHNVNLDQLIEDLRTAVRDGRELLKAGASGIRERAVAGAQTTERAIREHPYQSIGLIFGAGVLVGLLAATMFSGGAEESED